MLILRGNPLAQSLKTPYNSRVKPSLKDEAQSLLRMEKTLLW
jgi:hypothetical protein